MVPGQGSSHPRQFAPAAMGDEDERMGAGVPGPNDDTITGHATLASPRGVPQRIHA